ncbi:MAG TPA: DNA-binding protein [Eoetvoesiella sp.]|jgi:plasmid stability protein|uniref:FitA-like ribbon-helix-helix domain-containing protein n=1 Tax=Eoetvoesiella sp. TaxID=1966355 RepID=UPI002CD0A3C9|nr:DNA-binding protein [Eoetvoesiella sp.]HWK62511.1 DNA-binding protein [Eoetvoesiella sp.]
MTTSLVVRNIEPEVVAALRQAAARHGTSAEAEHRRILRMALVQPPRRSFKDVLMSMPHVGVDEDFDFRSAR